MTTGFFLLLYIACLVLAGWWKKRKSKSRKAEAPRTPVKPKRPASVQAPSRRAPRRRRASPHDAKARAARRALLAQRRKQAMERLRRQQEIDGKEPESIDVAVAVDVIDFYFEEAEFNRERFVLQVELTNNTGRELGYIDGVVRVLGPGDDLLKTIGVRHEGRLKHGETVEIQTFANFIYHARHEEDLAGMDIAELDFAWETRDVRYADLTS